MCNVSGIQVGVDIAYGKRWQTEADNTTAATATYHAVFHITYYACFSLLFVAVYYESDSKKKDTGYYPESNR